MNFTDGREHHPPILPSIIRDDFIPEFYNKSKYNFSCQNPFNPLTVLDGYIRPKTVVSASHSQNFEKPPPCFWKRRKFAI